MERLGTGRYEVTFLGIWPISGGVAHVTALSSLSRRCDVTGWGTASPDVTVGVECTTRTGVAADTPLVLNFTALAALEGKVGYLWADQPVTESYEPESAYQYNSLGNVNRVHRDGLGDWTATLPDLGANRGDVQVSAYGASAVCRVVEWFSGSGDLIGRVRCHGLDGLAVDVRWTLTYLRAMGFKGAGRTPAAYLWANRPMAASYVPNADYRWSSAGTVPTITRIGVGAYTVALPGMPLGGSAQVTAYGGGTRRCNVSAIRRKGLPQRIGVRCFGLGGAAADARFTLTYTK